MLRGLKASIVPVAGMLFIDIKPKSLPVVKDASGEMLPPDGMLARDQVLAGLGDAFSACESGNVRSDSRNRNHASQSYTLHSQQERFTQEVFPRPPWRGPVEATPQAWD